MLNHTSDFESRKYPRIVHHLAIALSGFLTIVTSIGCNSSSTASETTGTTPTNPSNPTNTVATYTNPSIYPAVSSLSLSVNGTTVPISGFQPSNATQPEYYYAHFSFSGTAALTVTANANIQSASISPLAFGLTPSVSGDALSFSLSQSRYLIVKINSMPELVIAADPLEINVPAVTGASIYNVVQDYGADNSGASYATTAIQEAVNDAAIAGGGTVYVPDGVYKIGNLVLKSNVTLYLTGGAVLRGSGIGSDYANEFSKSSLNMNGTWLVSTAPGSSNITIRGRGTIDGNGIGMRAKNNFLSDLIVPIATSKFTIDGITGRDAGFWSVVPIQSQNVTITNYKGLQSLGYAEDDAVDINESQNVTVQHALAISFDDTYSTKTWSNKVDIAANWPDTPQVISNVTFDDIVAWTHCAAFKVGNGADEAHSNVIFQNGYVYNSSRAIAVDPTTGGAVLQQLTFSNLDIERVEYAKQGPYWLQLIAAYADSQNIMLQDVNVRDTGTGTSVIQGNSSSAMVNDVTFQHVVVKGVVAGSLSDLHAAANSYTSGLQFLP